MIFMISDTSLKVNVIAMVLALQPGGTLARSNIPAMRLLTQMPAALQLSDIKDRNLSS